MNAYALHTASNGASHVLAGYLEGMGGQGYFDRLYGPDPVQTRKTGPLYYQRILTECALQSTQALSIDGNPQATAHEPSLTPADDYMRFDRPARAAPGVRRAAPS